MRPIRRRILLAAAALAAAPLARAQKATKLPVLGILSPFPQPAAPTLERCAHYIDLVLRGANVAEMPVELPTAYQIAINLRTAKTLGLAVPQPLLLRADKVIE
jgi:putative ABC transport system substrate-binding protein